MGHTVALFLYFFEGFCVRIFVENYFFPFLLLLFRGEVRREFFFLL